MYTKKQIYLDTPERFCNHVKVQRPLMFSKYTLRTKKVIIEVDESIVLKGFAEALITEIVKEEDIAHEEEVSLKEEKLL